MGIEPDSPVRDRLPDHQRAIDWADEKIVNQPRRVILVFLLLTGILALGLGNISTAAGTQQFTSGLPSEQALERVTEEFNPTFAPDTGSTTLIQRGGNVLSKTGLERMLTLQDRLLEREGLRITDSGSAAQLVAGAIDPTARTPDEQLSAVERATTGEIDAAVARVAETNPQFETLLSTDFNRESASASATIGTVTHEVPAGLAAGAGQSGDSPLTPIQLRIQHIENSVDGEFIVFGNGILAQEFQAVILDSLLIVVPAAVVLILAFLLIAYRDPIDLSLGLAALLMTIVWTFGFMGLVGIPFSQLLIAVPPLLLAVGIDFGIHAVNRYREERVTGAAIGPAMAVTTDQLVVAFFIVTGTTVIGFAANFTSSLGPIRDFGLVASIGIVFTFLIFGVFLPAAKVELDRIRSRTRIPSFGTTPLGSEGSRLSGVLRIGVLVARRAPAAFLLVILVTTTGAGVYATGIDTTFSQEEFLPPEENPDFLEELPEPFRPQRYTVTSLISFLEDNFESTGNDEVIMYVEAPMTRDTALESIYRAGRSPPPAILRDGRQAEARSLVSVIRSHAARDPDFARLVRRHDRDGNGIPDDDLQEVYDALLSSPAGEQARFYLTADYRSSRIVYSVETDAEQTAIDRDARALAERFRETAIPTGRLIVFQAVSDQIFDSALVSLTTALIGATLFLVFIYWLLEGRAGLGIANMVPIVVTIASIAATMRYVGIAFNAITATILAITIGLGIDYSVHITHRFADERARRPMLPALDRTVRGTGGALLGSMLTTVFGIGVLALALFPAIGQFGIMVGLSILYSFLASLLILPAALVSWDHLVLGDGTLAPLFGIGRRPWMDDAQTIVESRSSGGDPGSGGESAGGG